MKRENSASLISNPRLPYTFGVQKHFLMVYRRDSKVVTVSGLCTLRGKNQSVCFKDEMHQFKDKKYEETSPVVIHILD